MSDRSSSAIELIPMLAILGDSGSPVGLRMVRWLTEGDILPTPSKPMRMEAGKAISSAMSSIPDQVRTLVAPAGDFQWRLIRLISSCEEFADFLNTQDSERSWHYTLSALSFTNRDADANRFAGQLLHQSRQQFLAQLSDTECARTVFRVFAALPRKAYAPETYRWILNVGKTHDAEAIIDALGRPTDPLKNLLLYVRNQAYRRQIQSSKFPAPPLSIPNLLEPLTSEEALAEEGRKMRNCAASLAERVQAGSYFIYRWLGDERATVAIARRRNGRWKIAEVKALANAPVKPETKSAIYTAIRDWNCSAFDERPLGKFGHGDK